MTTMILCQKCQGQFPMASTIFVDAPLQGSRGILDRAIQCPLCSHRVHSCYTTAALKKEGRRVTRLHREAQQTRKGSEAWIIYEKARQKYQRAFDSLNRRAARFERSGQPPIESA